MKTLKTFTGIIIGAFVLGFVMVAYQAQFAIGSVAVTAEYTATTTGNTTAWGAFSDSRLIKTGYGTLGSVVVTGANTGVVNFYDATTTDVTRRTNNIATTSLPLMASLPVSLVAGTYTFDVWFTNGLLLDLEVGLMPTTTVTYRR